MTPVTSVAWAASKVLLSNPGQLFGLSVRIATPGSCYLIVLDAATVPADTTDVTTAAYKRIVVDTPTTTAANQLVSINLGVEGYPSNSGVRLTAGAIVLLSSTAPTSITGVPSGLWVSLAEIG